MNARAALVIGGLLLASAYGAATPAAHRGQQPSTAPQTEQFSHDGWRTNFEKHSVPLSEISSRSAKGRHPGA